jgi:hypothetical protein
MKIKPGYMLRDIAGQPIVVAVGPAAEHFNGVINLNQTGAFIWRQLIEGTTPNDLLHTMLATFEVNKQTAEADIQEFVRKLEMANILE